MMGEGSVSTTRVVRGQLVEKEHPGYRSYAQVNTLELLYCKIIIFLIYFISHISAKDRNLMCLKKFLKLCFRKRSG
jgi:hypothetical protein